MILKTCALVFCFLTSWASAAPIFVKDGYCYQALTQRTIVGFLQEFNYPDSVSYRQLSRYWREDSAMQNLVYTLEKRPLRNNIIYTFTDIYRNSFVSGRLIGWDLSQQGHPVIQAEDNRIYMLNGATIDWTAVRFGRAVPELYDLSRDVRIAFAHKNQLKTPFFGNVVGYTFAGKIIFALERHRLKFLKRNNFEKMISKFEKSPKISDEIRALYLLDPMEFVFANSKVALFKKIFKKDEQSLEPILPWQRMQKIPLK